VGRLILQAACGNLKKVSLELGGKSPVIVFPDADLNIAVPGAARAIFNNSGQVCAAGSRLYAHQSVFERLIEGVAQEAGKLKIGPGLNPDTQMGPLVSQEQLERVSRYVSQGRSDGATVVTGGSRVGNEGYFIAPTILTETKPEMSVVREEIFGPVLCAMTFGDDDLDRIADEANRTTYGLAASVWTRNLGTAHKMARRLRAGSIGVNMHGTLDPAMPFGGYKQSGWGREKGKEVLDLYTEVKAVVMAL
jgi:phenylacetaldehyde dehydrogenase